MRKLIVVKCLGLTIIALAIFSCSNSKLESALAFSGENRGELEKVLEHFEKGSEEYRAAVFLIENMPGHKCMTGDYAGFYDDVRGYLACGYGVSVADSLTELSKRYDGSIKYEYVANVISAEYLIRNIERAFDQWREGDWARHLNFGEFCEWLLPYTCSNTQPLTDWRNALEYYGNEHIEELDQCVEFVDNPIPAVKVINDSLREVMKEQKFKYAFKGFPIYDMDILASLPGASCKNYTETAALLYRSKGIPVAIDFITQWPAREGKHDWTVFPTLRGKVYAFDPFFGIMTYEHNPYAKYAKVFRRTYAPNMEYLELLRRNNGNIPPIFEDPFFVDVTHQYVKPVDIEVELLSGVEYYWKDLYIAVFDNNEWVPVYWGKRKGRKACFKNLGTNITYIVLGYENRELVPLSHPFKLDLQGNIEYLTYNDGKQKCDFDIWRKFSMLNNVYRVYNYLKGGYVEASNDKNFKSSEIVCCFDSPSWTSGIVDVVQSQPYRYWRCCTDKADTTDFAELYFYVNENKSYVPVGGVDSEEQQYSNLFDGDPLTNYRIIGNGNIGYIDYGGPVTMNHISYVRRGDGNAIIPGDKYEIYYWKDSRWVLHSEHIAEDVKLSLKGIPDGSLCYIKGVSRGRQNRIFRYKSIEGKLEWL